MDAPIWDATVFTKNRERLVEGEIASKFMAAVLSQPRVRELLSSEHFSVDGTLIEAWASMKSFRPKDGSGEPPAAGRNGERDFHGEKRRNETHASTSDPDARLYRKGPGQTAKLAYMGHVMMENRHGLAVDTRLTLATGTAEREAALAMAEARPGNRRITVGADKSLPSRKRGPTMPPGSSQPCASATPPRMSLRTPATGARRSTAAPPAIPVTPSVAGDANASRRSSGGPRRRPDCARPVIAEWRASVGSLPSPPPPTTWCVCPSYWVGRHSHARIAPQCRARGQNPVRGPLQYRNLCNHGVCLHCLL